MCSYHVICDFSSLLNLDVVQFARILLIMVKHMIFRDHVDDHPRAGWSDHMDGLPCDRGGGQAAHSRQGWCYWHLRGGPFQELDQPEITICCAGVPQRHQRASRSRDWGRLGNREAYVPEVTMIIINDNFYKVNRCLARYSPRATTTGQPINRAQNEPAMVRNAKFGPNLVVSGQKILFLLEKSKVLLVT